MEYLKRSNGSKGGIAYKVTKKNLMAQLYVTFHRSQKNQYCFKFNDNNIEFDLHFQYYYTYHYKH